MSLCWIAAPHNNNIDWTEQGTGTLANKFTEQQMHKVGIQWTCAAQLAKSKETQQGNYAGETKWNGMQIQVDFDQINFI